jgi:penicillin amidase
MDLLRRHASGELAEVFGPPLLSHDRLQRTLQIRASAERALAAMPEDQRHMLERYADGVNAAIAQMGEHLPLEFRVLHYKPERWTAKDSVLVGLSMFEDLTNTYTTKVAREALLARLPPDQEAELAADLYPVGSWRDHPPNAPPVPDLSVPGPLIEDIPLDESQARLKAPAMPTVAGLTAAVGAWVMKTEVCDSCTPGSNNWVVSGEHTASGKPLLSNDMHLAHTLPGIWYEADLAAATEDGFHVAGVTVPGLPLIIVGHNAHIAWGFTNLGGDVQDVYVETLRGAPGREEFQATDGSWQPVVHAPETIKVRGGKDLGFDVAMTRHSDVLTPILNQAVMPMAAVRSHVLSLRWTIYDPAVVTLPTLAIDSAHDWASFLTAFSTFGGPSQNVVYADDQGHIGYHAMGKIPLRGAPVNPQAGGLPGDVAAPVAESQQSGAPLGAAEASGLGQTDLIAPAAPVVKLLSGPISQVPFVPSVTREWIGYIPFEKMPQVFDPAGGVIATANARTTADDYAYPITQNWASPYRNDRLWHLLARRTGMKAADMLPIQMDTYSDFDHVLAQRLAYALDSSLQHADKKLNAQQTGALKQAADLLRTFDGRMRTDSAAAAIVSSTHRVLWAMLLEPHLQRMIAPAKNGAAPVAETPEEINALYQWGEKDYALEQMVMHTPARWLPKGYANWNDFLTAAIERGLTEAHAPVDLSKWRYGQIHTLDIEHPVFEQSPALTYLYGLKTGTGTVPQSGDGTTIKQAGHLFGPSERFTADMADLDKSTLNVVTGESGNTMSPWYLDQFPAWFHGTTFALPFSDEAVGAATKHKLTLVPAGR